MTVKIGDKSYATRRPQNLDEVLVSSTGMNAAEVGQGLGSGTLAGVVAQALVPFLTDKDAPSVAELSAEIAAAGVPDVADQVRKLYAPAIEEADAGSSTSSSTRSTRTSTGAGGSGTGGAE